MRDLPKRFIHSIGKQIMKKEKIAATIKNKCDYETFLPDYSLVNNTVNILFKINLNHMRMEHAGYKPLNYRANKSCKVVQWNDNNLIEIKWNQRISKASWRIKKNNNPSGIEKYHQRNPNQQSELEAVLRVL